MRSTELVLQAKREGPIREFRIWPTMDSIPPGILRETRTYVFELRNVQDPQLAHLFVDDIRLDRDFPPEPGVVQWPWRIGFYAGAVDLRLALGHGVVHEFTVNVDPDLTKLTRSEFDQMVQEIMQDTLALLSLSSFRWGTARGTGSHPPQIAQLEYLWTRVSKIEEVVRQISERPVRLLESEPITTPYHRVRELRGTDIARSLGRGQVDQVDAASATHLPVYLKDYFPRRILTTQKTIGLDIREHRAIKGSLESWASWLQSAAERLDRQALMGGYETEEEVITGARKWSKRCRAVSRRLRKLLDLPLFQNVSSTTTPVHPTPIFQRIPTYARFLSLHRDFSLALASLPGNFLSIPLSRTFDLYELWVFLRILRSMHLAFPADHFDPRELFDRSHRENYVVAASPISVSINDQIVVNFQREFGVYWQSEHQLGSFSKPMRPDVSIEIRSNDQPVFIVVDAKYRIQAQLNDALSSAHMYRDALVREEPSGMIQWIVQGSYLASPHKPENMTEDWRNTPLPDRLFHKGYQDQFRIGALTLLPGQPLSSLKDELLIVLRRAGFTWDNP